MSYAEAATPSTASLQDVERAYRTLLGRKPSPASFVKILMTMTPAAVLERLARSDEFRKNVIVPLVQGGSLVHERRRQPPSAEEVDWLVETSGAPKSLASALHDIATWRDLLSGLIANGNVAKSKVTATDIETMLRHVDNRLTALLRPDLVKTVEIEPRETILHSSHELAEPGRAAEAIGLPPLVLLDPLPTTALTSVAALKATATADLVDAENIKILAFNKSTVSDDPLARSHGETIRSLLQKAFHHGAFDNNVLRVLVERHYAPHDMSRPRVTRAFREWCARRMPLSGAGVTAVGNAISWKQLLLAHLTDADFRAVVFGVDSRTPKLRYLLTRIDGIKLPNRPVYPRIATLQLLPKDAALFGRVLDLPPAMQDPAVMVELDFGSHTVATAPLTAPTAEEPAWTFIVPIPLPAIGEATCFAHATIRAAGTPLPGSAAAMRFNPHELRQLAPPAMTRAELSTFGRIVFVKQTSISEGHHSTVLHKQIQSLRIGRDELKFEAAFVSAEPAIRWQVLTLPESFEGRAVRPTAITHDDAEIELDPPATDLLAAPLEAVSLSPLQVVKGHSYTIVDWHTDRYFTLRIDGEDAGSDQRIISSHPFFAACHIPTAFEIPVPARFLDGKTHTAELQSVAGADRRILCSFRIKFGVAEFYAMLECCKSDDERTCSLNRLIDAQRLDLLQQYFERTDIGVPLEETILLLARAFVKMPLTAANHPLRELYDSLWRQVPPSSSEADKVLTDLVETIMAADDGNESRIVHDTAHKHLIIDLCLSIWQKDVRNIEVSTKVGRWLLALNRPALSLNVIDRALHVSPLHADLLGLKAKIAAAHGKWDEAEHLARLVLASKPGHGDSCLVLSRVLQARGDHLDAIRVATRGKGMSHVGKAGGLDKRTARLGLPVGWLDWSRKAFVEDPSGVFSQLLNKVARQDAATARSFEETFSVFFLPPRKRSTGYQRDFEFCGPLCLLVACAEDAYLQALPALGSWALVLREDRPLNILPIPLILASRRAGIDLLRIECAEQSGLLIGLMVRTQHLRHVGLVGLDEADQRYSSILRAVTLLAPPKAD